jgi:DNA-binding transcriptional MocR family regulator
MKSNAYLYSRNPEKTLRFVYTLFMNDLPIIQTNVPPGVIDLGMGNPDFDLLPMELLRRSADTYFTTSDPRYLQYGLEQGDSYFRKALTNFLMKAYGSPVNPDLLFVTAGASSALDLFCTIYTQPGDVIFVEEPSYFLALRIFEDHGLRVVPIPMDDEGLRLDALDEKLTEYRPKLIYIIPAFQNPSGRTLSQARREKLVERAQRYNFLVVADEAYQFLHYTQTPPGSFADYTEDVEQIISVNSFSKILAPGLRLGWIQAHNAIIKRLAGSGLLESGGGMNPYTSALVRGLIESGELEKNITSLQEEYASRLDAMDAALLQHLPTAVFTLPQGGFFFWVHLPGVDATELRRKAQGFKVDLRQGVLFSSQMGMQDYVRLSFCFYGPEAIEEGVKRLKDCLEK